VEKLSPTLKSLHWKDLVILVLAVAVVALGTVVLRDRSVTADEPTPVDGEAVQVFDVIVDREGRAFIDVLFDRPVGEGQVGEVLLRPPVTLSPSVGGTWRWRTESVLRFEPSGALPAATEFTLSVIEARLVEDDEYLTGDREHVVQTDRFHIERVEILEEPVAGEKNQVLLRGNFRFNYSVKPAELVTRVRLIDPLLGEDDPVEVELETGWDAEVIGFRAGPVRKELQERRLVLIVDGELTPSDGNVRLGPDFEKEIVLGSKEHLRVRSVTTQAGETESNVRIMLSSPVRAGIARAYVRLRPEVDARLSTAGNELVLTGPFLPGEGYELELGEGLPAIDEAVLIESYSTTIDVPHLEPSLGFAGEGVFLSRSGLGNVALESINVDSIDLSIDRVYLNNVFSLVADRRMFPGRGRTYSGRRVPDSAGGRLASWTVEVEGQPNQTATTVLSVDDWIDQGDEGLYRLMAGRPNNYQAEERWLLLTDLGIVVKQGADGLLVWVTSTRDLSAVNGATVTLLSHRNQTLSQGRTDTRGVWRSGELPDTASQNEAGRPFLITVEKGSDFTFLLLDQMRIDTTGLDVAGAQRSPGGYSAYIYGERDLYRPGETLEGVALVRTDDLEAPAAMPALLRRRDPQGRERESVAITVDDSGVADIEMEIPPHALTGRHSLELEVAGEVVGQYLYQVEEFVPDRIKVEIDPPAEVKPGEELVYSIFGAYLFGPPASALPYETRVELVDATFAPAGLSEFSFRDSSRELSRREVHAGEGALDDEGRSEVTVTLPDIASVPSSLEAVVTARVSEQGGRGVTALTRVRVHPYPYYIGLRREGDGYAEVGKTTGIEFVAVGPDGKERPSGTLRADLFKDRWNSVLRRTPSGSYRYESRRQPVLISSVAIPAGESRGRVDFNIADYGAYRVVIGDPETSASSEVSFYAAGWGFSPWALENPARVEIELDREEYRLGDTAVALLKTPFPGKLLLTVELDRVLYTSVRTIEGNTARIEIPVAAGWRPNAYVTATLVRSAQELETDGVARAFGAVPIRVDRAGNRLEVEIEAAETMRSESALTIGLSTAPRAAITVAAVDEGILQLVAQASPDPFEHFYRKLALGVQSFDTYALLLPEIEGQADAGGGEAGAGLAQYVRTEGIRRVKPVAFWSGVVRADSDGKARVEFQVPEFQGALRVMAVASNGRRFGSADSMVRVRDPLVVLPTFPRSLAIEESAEIPVTVRNDTSGAEPIVVSLAAEGGARVEGEASRSVPIESGSEATVYFKLETGDEAGEVELVALAEGNGERGRASAGVPIRFALPPRSEEVFGSIQEPRAEWAEDGSSWARPGTVTRSLRLGRFPLVQFAGHLESLLRYPYGCLEQTVSTAFPLVYLADLARELSPETLESGRFAPEPMVAAGISRVAGMQIYNGGFALWSGGTQPHLWGSIYATHFLVEARRAGHAVENGLYRRALAYVTQEARAQPSYGSYAELQRTAYALFVLARAGQPDRAAMDFLRERHLGSLEAESRALLMAAYAGDGNLNAVTELAAQVGDLGEVERQTGGNFDSALRNRALLLLAVLEAQPESPRIASLTEQLTREAAAARRWTTQESSFVFLALGQLAQRQSEKAAYSGTVFVGDRKLGTFDEKTTTFSGISEAGAVRVEMDPGYEPGAAFFSLQARGVPTDERFRPESMGLEIERTYLARDGSPLDLDRVEQGDLIVARLRVRSVAGPVENVVVQNLLPSGVEVENPRLATTERLAWAAPSGGPPTFLDLRDDRILLFVELASNRWQTHYALLRAVTPGDFHLPPAQVEAMYNPALRATGERGRLRVVVPGDR
jgi:uncharacterized protein YfaS (alpha-2-macroglobulin family)